MSEFSDYIIYVDESGDHGLDHMEPTYPVFVLAFCIFKVADYMTVTVPAMQRLKFKYFGHDMVILHEVDIRKARKPFAFLTDATLRDAFMDDLTSIIESSPFTVISVTVRKDQLKAKYYVPENPYNIAMKYGLERVVKFLESREIPPRKTHVVFEARGKREDQDLEVEFRRVCDGVNYRSSPFNLHFVLADKKTNSCGLQLADLIARPIGLKTFKPGQPNRAYDIIKPKFDRSPLGKIDGWGLKHVP